MHLLFAYHTAHRYVAQTVCNLIVDVMSWKCSNVIVRQVRAHGPGGAYLLFTERSGSMHTVRFGELRGRAPQPTGPPAANGAFPRNRGVGAGKQDNFYTAMHAAMRCVHLTVKSV